MERMEMMTKAIIANGLSKTYTGGKKAVSSLDISLEFGEVFGFLGPNGSGKTTAVKLLSGILVPTEGSCKVLDMDPTTKPEELHQYCGVLTEHARMYDHLTGLENLCFYGAVFGVSTAESKERALSLLEQLELSDAKDRKLGAYSTGMRQRLSFARSLIHRPKLLFLDEPTSALDPESILKVNQMIKSIAENEGTTIFLCTHQLRYAQEVCSSYGLIDDGVLLAIGDIDHLRGITYSGMTVSIETDKFPTDISPLSNEGQRYEINVDSEDEIPVLVKRIVREGGNIFHVSSRKLSLEEIYFALLEKRTSAKTDAVTENGGE